MKQVIEKLEELFSAFDTDAVIDLPAYRRSIEDEVHSFSAEYDALKARTADYAVLQEENESLRRLIAAECRAKLVLLGDATADEQVDELMKVSVSELKKRRDSILRRYDERFTMRNQPFGAQKSFVLPGTAEIKAFQS